MNYGVDRYSAAENLVAGRSATKSREEYLAVVCCGALPKREEEKLSPKHAFPAEPQENLLYFMEKNAPLLEPWQREILRIVRKSASILSAETDAGHERGLGDLLALHHLNHLYDEGKVTGALYAGVFTQPCQCRISAAL